MADGSTYQCNQNIAHWHTEREYVNTYGRERVKNHEISFWRSASANQFFLQMYSYSFSICYEKQFSVFSYSLT